MFSTKRSASAGATRSSPVWRPQARTTSASATSAAAASATQNEISGGSRAIAAGIAITATSRARRQLLQLKVKKPGSRASGRLAVISAMSRDCPEAARLRRGAQAARAARRRPRAAPARGQVPVRSLDVARLGQGLFLELGDVVERGLGVLLP